MVSLRTRLIAANRDRAREKGDFLEPGFFEPGLDLRVRMLPLVPRRVPFEGVAHTPLGIGMHGDLSQEAQGVKDRNAIHIVERNRDVAKSIEPSAGQAGREAALEATGSLPRPIQCRGEAGNQL
jgi:hypothetical protein